MENATTISKSRGTFLHTHFRAGSCATRYDLQMMPANISQEDRMSVTAFLLKLRDLSDSRTMADHWDYFVIDHLQQRSAVVDLVDTEDSLFKCQLIRQKILDNFGSAWCRAV